MPGLPSQQQNFRAVDSTRDSLGSLDVLRMCPSRGAVSARERWIAGACEEVLNILEMKAAEFLRRGSGSLFPIIDVARHKRYAFIERLFTERDSHGSRAGRELLRWISTGYILEFARQTENNIRPLNIANPERPLPEAQRYWASQPPGALQREAEYGVRHSALAYDALREELFRGRAPEEPKLGRKVALDTTAEMIRTSIDLFRVRGREFFKDTEVRASIYNDHVFVVEYAKRYLSGSRVA